MGKEMETSKSGLSIGDTVELKPETVVGAIPSDREDNATAVIQKFLPEIVGAFKTDRDLRGCRYWNVEHVRKVDLSGRNQDGAQYGRRPG